METQILNVPTDMIQAPRQGKPGEPQLQVNSQGGLIPVPSKESSDQEVISFMKPLDEFIQEQTGDDDIVCLGETVLSGPEDCLCAPTDDTGMEHKVISCGHVLKSTHDLAHWSEKTGTHRVNDAEALNSTIDSTIYLGNSTHPGPTLNRRRYFGNSNNGRQQWRQVNSAGSGVQSQSQIINSWPVLKSTHDDASWAEKKGTHSVNHDANPSPSSTLDELVLAQGHAQNPDLSPSSKSRIIHSWPVLKSTHDEALWSEKHGSHSVNHNEGCSETLDELAMGQGRGRGRGPGLGHGQWSPRGQAQGRGPSQQAQQPQSQEEGSEIINSWPVLKSTHDEALWTEKRGTHSVNSTVECVEVLDELAVSQPLSVAQCDPQMAEQDQGSSILHSWPVLKSTHDQATIGEKRGPYAVNNPGTSAVLDEVVQDKGPGELNIDQSSVQAGGGHATHPMGQGSSLQTGLDTQAACHVQLEDGMEEIGNLFVTFGGEMNV